MAEERRTVFVGGLVLLLLPLGANGRSGASPTEVGGLAIVCVSDAIGSMFGSLREASTLVRYAIYECAFSICPRTSSRGGDA